MFTSCADDISDQNQNFILIVQTEMLKNSNVNVTLTETKKYITLTETKTWVSYSTLNIVFSWLRPADFSIVSEIEVFIQMWLLVTKVDTFVFWNQQVTIVLMSYWFKAL